MPDRTDDDIRSGPVTVSRWLELYLHATRATGGGAGDTFTAATQRMASCGLLVGLLQHVMHMTVLLRMPGWTPTDADIGTMFAAAPAFGVSGDDLRASVARIGPIYEQLAHTGIDPALNDLVGGRILDEIMSGDTPLALDLYLAAELMLLTVNQMTMLQRAVWQLLAHRVPAADAHPPPHHPVMLVAAVRVAASAVDDRQAHIYWWDHYADQGLRVQLATLFCQEAALMLPPDQVADSPVLIMDQQTREYTGMLEMSRIPGEGVDDQTIAMWWAATAIRDAAQGHPLDLAALHQQMADAGHARIFARTMASFGFAFGMAVEIIRRRPEPSMGVM